MTAIRPGTSQDPVLCDPLVARVAADDVSARISRAAGSRAARCYIVATSCLPTTRTLHAVVGFRWNRSRPRTLGVQMPGELKASEHS